MTARHGWRRFLQFRFSTLLAVMTGIAIGFAPLKLWEVWRAPTPAIIVEIQFVEIDGAALAELLEQKPSPAGEATSIPVEPTLLEKLQSLRSDGKVSVLSSPSVMTTDGQTANVRVGAQMQPRQGGALVDVGLDYSITPKTLRNGVIHLAYDLTHKDLVARGENDSIRQRRITGQVEARNDQQLLVCSTNGSVDPVQPAASNRELLVLLRARKQDFSTPLLTPRALPRAAPATTAAVPRDLRTD